MVEAVVTALPIATAVIIKKSAVMGNLLLLTAKTCGGLYPVLEKRLMKRYEPTFIVMWGYIYGCVMVFASLVPTVATTGLPPLSDKGVVAALFGGFLASGVGHLIGAEVNHHTSPVLVMAFSMYQIVCTPTLSWLFLGQALTTRDIVGGSVITLGVVVFMIARMYDVHEPGKAGVSSSSSSNSSSARSYHPVSHVAVGVSHAVDGGSQLDASGLSSISLHGAGSSGVSNAAVDDELDADDVNTPATATGTAFLSMLAPMPVARATRAPGRIRSVVSGHARDAVTGSSNTGSSSRTGDGMRRGGAKPA
ncbi:MAG: EamA family transporter [Methanobacteriota archaeon]|nr:MAG: EamA family transporter [Euryarchaeota archaeon]